MFLCVVDKAKKFITSGKASLKKLQVMALKSDSFLTEKMKKKKPH
jgi:hypothetical protein